MTPWPAPSGRGSPSLPTPPEPTDSCRHSPGNPGAYLCSVALMIILLLSHSLPFAHSLTHSPRAPSTLDATEFGRACPQIHNGPDAPHNWTEDCLLLNVFMPQNVSAGAQLPGKGMC
jgi:hypothetical protein